MCPLDLDVWSQDKEMVARLIQFLSHKLWFPNKPSKKLHQKCCEPSRTLELILPKSLIELRRCEVRKEGPLAQNHIAPGPWSDIFSPGLQPDLFWFIARSLLQRFL